MIDKFYHWIDQKLETISRDDLFLKYFENIDLINIEDSLYLSNKANGIEIVLLNNLVVSSIHFFSAKTYGFGLFKDELPISLEFSLDRISVHKKLGKPNKSGGGNKALYIGKVPFWDKYYFETYSVHIQYLAEGESINTITIASLKLEEYFNSNLQ